MLQHDILMTHTDVARNIYAKILLANLSLSARRMEEKMTWDWNLVDKMLYLATPEATFLAAFILLAVYPPSPLQTSIRCHYPAEFTRSYISYADRICLSNSNSSELHLKPEQLVYSNKSVTVGELFPVISIPNEKFSFRLFIMTMSSLLPLLLWRLVGEMDGRDFLACTGPPSNWKGFAVFFWFLFTKLGSAALCCWFVREVFDLHERAGQYLMSVDAIRQTREFDVICSYQVRRLGANYARYTVQCQLFTTKSSEQSWEFLLQPVILSLQTWFTLLLAMSVCNLLSSVALLITCSRKSNRILFISRNISSGVDRTTAAKLETWLGFSGTFVAIMSAKSGHGESVRFYLTNNVKDN